LRILLGIFDFFWVGVLAVWGCREIKIGEVGPCCGLSLAVKGMGFVNGFGE
jgi:hypothetical protein